MRYYGLTNNRPRAGQAGSPFSFDKLRMVSLAEPFAKEGKRIDLYNLNL